MGVVIKWIDISVGEVIKSRNVVLWSRYIDGDVDICPLWNITTFVSSHFHHQHRTDNVEEDDGQPEDWKQLTDRPICRALSSTIAVIPFQGNESDFLLSIFQLNS